MEMTLKYICFFIFVTSINGSENTTELYESEHSEDYLKETENTTVLYEGEHSTNYLEYIPYYNEVNEKFISKLDNLLYKFQDLEAKTLHLENENLNLIERLTKTEENLKISEEGLKRIEYEQNETKEVFSKSDADLEERVKKLAGGLERIKISESVPIGFIYVQLPFQQEPNTLWPGTTWINISNKYSDHFFRVEGPNTRPFGETQTDAFQGHWHELTYEVRYKDNQGIRIGGNMARFTFGYYQPDETTFNHVRNAVNDLSNGYPRIANETRPINYAVRVWRRTK